METETKAVKKVEIITNSVELNEMKRVLDRLKVSGYSIIPGVTGMGDRGRVEGDEMTGVCTNVYLLVVCSEEKSLEVTEAMRPVIKRCGGICLVSDATYLKHAANV
jgi:nitrogen regulatory protein PII